MTVTDTPPADVPVTPPAEPSVAQLAAALAAVQSELPRVRKSETGEVKGTTKDGKYYSYEYSYADLASVSAAVLPLLGKHGLAFTAWPTTTPRGFLLRYSLLHESGEMMTGEYPLPVDVKSPQAMGSAITYARRYALCSVIGVSPDDDDDAAAAEGAKASRRADQQEAVDSELSHARDVVRGAWANQYGEFDQAAAGEMFRSWSKGGTLLGATAGQLRAFGAYLHSLPATDAGGDPEPTLLPPATEQQPSTPAEPRKMTKLQQGKIFALMADLSLNERQQQLRFLSDAVGRPLKSRSELTLEDAKVVIDILEEAAQNVSGPAPTAQSAAAGDRVPAGPETQSSGGE